MPLLSYRQRRFFRLLLSFAVGIAGAVTLYFAQYLFPAQPDSESARRYVVDLLENATLSLGGADMRITNARVLATYPLARAQVVVVAYQQVTAQTGTGVDYYEIRIVVKYWFDGVGTKRYTQGIYADDLARPAFTLTSLHHEGVYLIAGGTKRGDIARARVKWGDNSETIIPLADGTFFLAREDGVAAAWVEGLDDDGTVASNSLAFPNTNVLPTEYTAVGHVTVPGGMVILSAFSATGSGGQECVEMTYLTAENATKYLTGGGALTRQRVCVASAGRSLGPSASTVINNDTVVVGGRVLNSAATRIGMIWSDGFQLTVPIVDGLFLVQRTTSSARVDEFVLTDEAGAVVAP